jgi:hypothetical protein
MERKRWLPHFQSTNRTQNRKVIRNFPSSSKKATLAVNANNKYDHMLGYIQDLPPKSRQCSSARNPGTKNLTCQSTMAGIWDENGDLSRCFTIRKESNSPDIMKIDDRKDSLPMKKRTLSAMERHNLVRT